MRNFLTSNNKIKQKISGDKTKNYYKPIIVK